MRVALAGPALHHAAMCLLLLANFRAASDWERASRTPGSTYQQSAKTQKPGSWRIVVAPALAACTAGNMPARAAVCASATNGRRRIRRRARALTLTEMNGSCSCARQHWRVVSPHAGRGGRSAWLGRWMGRVSLQQTFPC